MMRGIRRRRGLLSAAFGLLFLAQAQARCPAQLRIGFLDYELAPLLLGRDKSQPPQGKLVDWVRQAVVRAGCTSSRLELLRFPIIRGRELLSRNEIDIWAVAFPGADLLAIGALPMDGEAVDPQLGFYSASYSLYIDSRDTTVSWNGSKLSGPDDLRVGVAPVPALRALVAERNWTPENGMDTQNVLNKLVSGRSTVAILPDLIMSTQTPEVLERLRRLTPPVLTSWYYSVASKDLLRRHPAFIKNYWLEMCRAGRADQQIKAPCRE
ncbi:hypothetical protein [Roseateles microcysteis]|uniref:hypothetical protein n=1 Tax=Roseateles microcysteis TaxID=3119057 RepID=UPI002FE520DD